MSFERYKGYRLAPDENGCWDVLDVNYEPQGTFPSKTAAKRHIDEEDKAAMTLTPNPHQNEELREAITSIMYGAGWKKRDIADAFKPDVEAAMKLITQYGDTREREGRIDELNRRQFSSKDGAEYYNDRYTELTNNTEG